MLPRVTSMASDQTIMLIQAACTLMELLVWWESSKSAGGDMASPTEGGAVCGMWFWGIWKVSIECDI